MTDITLSSAFGSVPLTSSTGTIASGASLSGAVDCTSRKACRLAFPATFEPTSISFQESMDGVTYRNVCDQDGAELVVSAASFAGVSVPLNFNDFMSCNYIKVRGGTAALPSVVGADRIITVIKQ